MHVEYSETTVTKTLIGVLSDWTANGVLGVKLAEGRVTGKNQFVLWPLVRDRRPYYTFDYQKFRKDWINIMEAELGFMFEVVPLHGTMYGYTLVERRGVC